MSDAQSTIQNTARDSETIAALKEQIRAANEDAANARHERTKQMDEFTSERVQLVSQLDRLKSENAVVAGKDAKQQQTIAELQAEMNAKARKEREAENNAFKMQSQLDSVKKDLSFESQRLKDLTRDLAEER